VSPILTIEDFDVNTFRKMRAHSWLKMTNEEMLKSMGFWRKDTVTNGEGYVLSAALLFGNETTILSCCLFYRSDAI